MKLNKRVLASAALSVSLATSAVAPPPVAWAEEMHVKCPQNFRVGSDFDGDVNAKVGKHLQRDCKFPADQISRLSIRDEEFGETTGTGTGGDQQSEPLLEVNDVKAGDRNVTGSVFLRPGQKKTVQVIFPNALTPTQELQFDQSSAESDDASRGKSVPFTIGVPLGLELHPGNKIGVTARYDNYGGEDIRVTVVVKPADNGNGKAPGGGAGEKPRKPPAPGGKPGKPHAPGGGAGDNPRTGGGSSSLGSS
ncbi:intracellular motility protein A [Corynebacterium belfantii]|uniref:intracellular motility protein A n=1 Tax=Corynebacterium belfantii TaxID=2014537 RepID=UPI003977660B